MDLEVNIKQEPAWPDGTTNASLENTEHTSDVVVLRKEVKSELTEPGSPQGNSFEPSKGIKKEICTEPGTIIQLVPNIKEETRSNLYGKSFSQKPHSCNVCGKSFRQKVGLSVHMKSHTGDMPYYGCVPPFDPFGSISCEIVYSISEILSSQKDLVIVSRMGATAIPG
ncbi:zinc finger protein 649 [Anabrus simplex]|uniref:zinc finger protein 649 n=1 Tax=Anabrus simplex TaxID=316456 RepID=UPI0035A26BE6